MVRKYLSIPATSAAAERVFSKGRRIVSWQRLALKPQTVEQLLCLKGWYQAFNGSSSQSLFQANKRREPQVETQDLTIMNTTSELLENSFPQPQRKVIALFHAFILPEEEEPNSIKIDRNRNSVIILAENIGHTTHPLSDSSEMKIEDG
ncbi:hypothetical protein H4Q26_016678 [Puccinia striiformis f. sp. tritici PST-130]|nr:hypothetical protein H4Q26_016678 [Puccinia striiformis f. sp. tritici PST-130]